MTRETKIGLVVAGSFLCLVCVVVASKMNGGGDTFEESKQPPTGPTNVVAAAAQQGKEKPSSEKQPSIATAPTSQVRENGPAPTNPPGLSVNSPPKAKTAEQAQKELQDTIKRQKEKDKPMFVPAPLGSTTIDVVQFPAPPATVPDVKMTVPSVESATPANPQRGASGPAPAPSPPSVFGSNPDAVLTPPPQVPPLKPIDPAIPLLPPGGANPAKASDPIPLPANPPMPVQDSFPIPKDVPLPVVPKGNQKPFGAAPDPVVPALDPPPVLPAPNGVNPPSVPSGLPPASINPPFQPRSLPPASINPPFQTPMPVPLVPPPSLAPPGPIPTITTTPLPSTPPIQVTPGSATPIPTLPTLPAGGFNSLPPVRSIEPDIVKVAPGETTFAQMSTRLYRDPKYAVALQAFNRDHWQALADGQALAVNQPVLNPNQQVLHPPVGILERDYAKLIGGGAPTAVIPVMGSTPIRPAPVAPSAPPVTTLPAGARAYTVQTPGGERIRDIALRQLGNADRWTDIYRLNPNLQPQFAIPQGVQLQLP